MKKSILKNSIVEMLIMYALGLVIIISAMILAMHFCIKWNLLELF